MIEQNRLMTTAEVARRLSVSPWTVNRWANAGTIRPAMTLPGYKGDRLYEPAEVLELLQRRNGSIK